MSNFQTTAFLESRKEAQEEREYFDSLLQESLLISRARRQRAEEIRKIGLVCWRMGFINVVQYIKLCERNSIKPLWRAV